MEKKRISLGGKKSGKEKVKYEILIVFINEHQENLLHRSGLCGRPDDGGYRQAVP